jgi:lipid A 3-O-deacylase
MKTDLNSVVRRKSIGYRDGQLSGKKRKQIAVIGLSFLSIAAQAQAVDSFQTIWSVLGGSGRSHPGWGSTQLEVKTSDFVLRVEHPVSAEKGTGLLRNRHYLAIDVPVHVLRDMNQPPMVGVYFHTCWIFAFHPLLNPYVFAGGGPVFTQAQIPGTSSLIRGAYGFGAGIRLKMDSLQLILETRYHHLSNGGIKKPNNPLNSHKILLGVILNPSDGKRR